MSGFNPYSVGGVEPTPQDLQNALGLGNTLTDNFLDNANYTLGNLISFTNLNGVNYPNLWIYNQFGAAEINIIPLNNNPLEGFKPLINVITNNGVDFTRTSIKGDGVYFYNESNGFYNQLTMDLGKSQFNNQTLYFPTTSGQLQTQETPINDLDIQNLQVYEPIFTQNTSLYVYASSLLTDYATINILEANIPQQLRIYIVFDVFGVDGTIPISVESTDLNIYTDNPNGNNYFNGEGLTMTLYGSNLFIHKISLPI
jgi:hypothetical protein